MDMRRSEHVVYCATCAVTNKSYIGWCVGFKERKARHIRESELGSKTRFHNAIRKHGVNSFEWFILFDQLGSQDECKIMERRMIAIFDTYRHGYNSTRGGDGGFTGNNSGQFTKGIKPWNHGKTMSPEYRKKLSASHIGTRQSIECINKRRSKQLGKICKQETRLKIAAKLNKPVVQKTLSGDLIRSFESISIAVKETGITNISGVCRGVFNQAGGFKWSYQ